MEVHAALQERVLGGDHPSAAITMHNLACLLRDSGRHGEARPLFERAQRVFEDRLLRATGEQAEAERLETRAAAAEGR